MSTPIDLRAFISIPVLRDVYFTTDEIDECMKYIYNHHSNDVSKLIDISNTSPESFSDQIEKLLTSLESAGQVQIVSNYARIDLAFEISRRFEVTYGFNRPSNLKRGSNGGDKYFSLRGRAMESETFPDLEILPFSKNMGLKQDVADEVLRYSYMHFNEIWVQVSEMKRRNVQIYAVVKALLDVLKNDLNLRFSEHLANYRGAIAYEQLLLQEAYRRVSKMSGLDVIMSNK